MTTTTFTAFGVTRRTENDYPWASRASDGRVRFHGTRHAAIRAAGAGRIARTRIHVTESQMHTLRTLVAARDARVDARTAAVLERHGWVTVKRWNWAAGGNYGGTIATITDAGREFVAGASA